MSAYRFCRTDDIGLLVDALNHCWAPSFPAEPLMTAAAFKRSIRDLQVWCSSCMVAFAGDEPIAVLIGAKRASATLVHKIAVHPEHQRQGHGRHLLTSLASKLAILGPPRIVAEVPGNLAAARALFAATGYSEQTTLTDYVWEAGLTRHEGSPRRDGDRVVIPVTVDDLAANGLLGDQHSRAAWERSPETLLAGKHEIEGIAVASDERLEACLLYRKEAAEILVLRSFVEDEGTRLGMLLDQLPRRGIQTARFPKVGAAEVAAARLEALGFRHAGRHGLYGTTARPE